MDSKDDIVNSKSEYMANNIVKLTIEEVVFQKKKKVRIEKKVDRIERELIENFRKSRSVRKNKEKHPID